MRRMLVLLCLLLAARPAAALDLPPGPGAAQDLSGAWFGERWTGAMLVQHLSHRGADGRFTVRFRFFRGCAEVGAQAQEGRWALEGEAFRTWIETVNGGPPAGERAITYVLEDLAGDRVAYRAPNGVLHRAFRVPADYAMPPPLGCEATS